MKVTRFKKTYCHTCKKDFHYLGINRHRAMHRDKKENCQITYTHGDTYTFTFEKITDPAGGERGKINLLTSYGRCSLIQI